MAEIHTDKVALNTEPHQRKQARSVWHKKVLRHAKKKLNWQRERRRRCLRKQRMPKVNPNLIPHYTKIKSITQLSKPYTQGAKHRPRFAPL